MWTNTNRLAIILCLNLLTCFTAWAGIESATVNQGEQDKARESALISISSNTNLLAPMRKRKP